MITKEKINENPFDSDYEEKLLFDKRISTPNKTKHIHTSPLVMFKCGHEEFHCNNMYKILPSTNHEKSKKEIREKMMVKLRLRRELFRVY